MLRSLLFLTVLCCLTLMPCVAFATEYHVGAGQPYANVNDLVAVVTLGDNDIVLRGLDMNDTQGDKAVVDYVRQLGGDVTVDEDAIRVCAGDLAGCELDLNATPDALPTLAVLGCFARGTTRLLNVPQARAKETDRITVMAQELAKLGAKVEELPDGIIVHESGLRGAEVDGHGDHRVVMALAVAGCSIPGTTVIHGAEAADVTYPEFVDHMVSIEAQIERAD